VQFQFEVLYFSKIYLAKAVVGASFPGKPYCRSLSSLLDAHAPVHIVGLVETAATLCNLNFLLKLRLMKSLTQLFKRKACSNLKKKYCFEHQIKCTITEIFDTALKVAFFSHA
jgi:hypothetical protein